MKRIYFLALMLGFSPYLFASATRSTDSSTLSEVAQELEDLLRIIEDDAIGDDPDELESALSEEIREGDLVDAVKTLDIELVRDLLSQGADPNEMTFNGMTPLKMAIKVRSVEIVRLLLENGAEVSSERHTVSLLMRAAASYDTEVVKLILAAEKKLPKAKQTIRASLVNLLRTLGGEARLEEVFDLLLQELHADEIPAVALVWACINRYFKFAKKLLDKGLSVNAIAETATKRTILMEMVFKSRLDAVEFLVANGADASLVDAWGETALVIAQGEHEFEIARFLEETSLCKYTCASSSTSKGF